MIFTYDARALWSRVTTTFAKMIFTTTIYTERVPMYGLWCMLMLLLANLEYVSRGSVFHKSLSRHDQCNKHHVLWREWKSYIQSCVFNFILHDIILLLSYIYIYIYFVKKRNLHGRRSDVSKNNCTHSVRATYTLNYPINQSVIPGERDDGCKNLSPMSPFRVKLTDPCAEGAIDKGIFRSTKLTTWSISEQTKFLIV